MKTDTAAVIVKGIGLVGSAVCLQLTASLGQWANEDTWPSRINWILIVACAVGAGFNGLVSYMSGSFSTWKQDRQNGSDPSGSSKP